MATVGSLHSAATAALDAGLCRTLKQDASQYVSGTFQLREPLSLYVITPGTAPTARCVPLNDDKALKQLTEAVRPQGSDASCTEFEPKSFALSALSLPPAELLADVQQLMQPKAHNIMARLQRLTLCGPGCAPTAAASTAEPNDAFGSLVLCLPSRFIGGQLVLSHEDTSRTMDWGQQQQQQQQQQQDQAAKSATAAAAAAQRASTSTARQAAAQAASTGAMLKWVAFSSSTQLSMQPVTSGCCIILWYTLSAVPAADAAATGPQPKLLLRAADVANSTAVYGELARLLANPKWHPEGTTLGLFSSTKYAAGIRGMSDAMFPEALQGADQLLYAAAAALGLQARVVPIYKAWWSSWGDGYIADEDLEEAECLTEEQYIQEGVMVGSSFDKEGLAMNETDEYTFDGNTSEYTAHLGAKCPAALGITWCNTTESNAFPHTDVVGAWYDDGPSLGDIESAVGLLITIPACGTHERDAMMKSAGGKRKPDGDGGRAKRTSKSKVAAGEAGTIGEAGGAEQRPRTRAAAAAALAVEGQSAGGGGRGDAGRGGRAGKRAKQS